MLLLVVCTISVVAVVAACCAFFLKESTDHEKYSKRAQIKEISGPLPYGQHPYSRSSKKLATI
jgi:hypothetical protein